MTVFSLAPVFSIAPLLSVWESSSSDKKLVQSQNSLQRVDLEVIFTSA